MKRIFDSKIFKVLFGILRGAFFLMVVVYLAFVLTQRITGNKSIFGYRMFTVATGSMAGVYEIFDVIAVKDCDVKKLKVGDDIAYQGSRGGLEGMLITHRIIKIEEGADGKLTFVTRGVSAPAADPSITEDQVLGQVVGVVPVISQLNHVVKSQLGFFLFVFCPLVVIIVLEILQTITDIQLERNEIQEIRKTEEEEELLEPVEYEGTDTSDEEEEEII